MEAKNEAPQQSILKASKIFPQVSGAITIDTSEQQSVFEIPAQVWKPDESYLALTWTPQSNAKANVAYLACLSLIRRIEFYTNGGPIMDLDFVNFYTKLVWKACTSLDEFNTLPKAINADQACVGETCLLQGVAPISAATATDPLTAAAGYSPNRLSGGVDIGVSSPTAYVHVGDDTTNGTSSATPVIRVKIPLKMLYNTLLSSKEHLYFPVSSYLRITWSTRDMQAFLATSNAAITVGTAVLAASPSISNLCLYVQQEKNQTLADQIKAKTLSAEGRDIFFTDTRSMLQQAFTSAGNQPTQLRITSVYGETLKHIFYGVFDSTENVLTNYMHNDIDSNLIRDIRFSTYYTMLDNNRVQSYDIDTSEYEDHTLMAPLLKGSVIQTPEMYAFNWVHIEDFTGCGLPLHKQVRENNASVAGLPIDHEIQYAMNMTGVGTANKHRCFASFGRHLNVSAAGIKLF